MALTVVLAVIGILLGILWWRAHCSHFAKLVAQIPGPATLPVIGHAHLLPTGATDFYNKVREFCRDFKQEDLMRVQLGPLRSMVLISKAECVETLLSSNKHIRKSAEYEPVLPWLGTGLLTSWGTKWRTRRRLITPSFHFRILQDFLHVFNEQASIMIGKLEGNVGGEAFDIFPRITNCALDIICETAMGKHVDAQDDDDSEYVKAVFKISELIHIRQKKPWLWPDIIYNNLPSGREHDRCLKILHGFTDQVICERRADVEEATAAHSEAGIGSQGEGGMYDGSKKRMAFLDMLLHAAEEYGLTHADLREEVDTFMFEGHDTTSAGVGWAVHLIGAHPDVQEKVHKEIDAVFGDSDREVTADDLKELKYLECVIKEAQRLFPSVPMFGRVLEEEVQIGKYMCPAGVSAIVVTTELHRDERFFPDPETFDPERFTLENAAGRHPYAYVPFSAGPRNCIGQKFALNEEKVMLSALLRHYNITSIHKTEDMSPSGELILRPAKGVWVKLTERS